MTQALESRNPSQRILNAAFDYISKNGYANVSLRDIATEAGVVLSQLHYYFKNKEGLLVAVIQMVTKRTLAEVENAIQSGVNAKERYNALVGYFQELLDERPRVFRVLVDLSSMALWSQTFAVMLNSLFDGLAELIEKYIVVLVPQEAAFHAYSPKTVARMLFGAVFGASFQAVLNEDQHLPDALIAVKTML